MRKESIFEKDNLIWSGNSVFETRGPYLPKSINLEMMGEDAGSTIFGQCKGRYDRGGRRFSSVKFRIEPEDNAVIQYFHTLIGGRSNNLEYNISQFLHMIARTIIVEDHFVYELQIGRDNKTNKIVKMDFSPVIAPKSKALIFGKYVIQLLPRPIAKQYNCSRICILDPVNTFIFQAPLSWRHTLRKARSAICFFDAMKLRLMDRTLEFMNSDKRREFNFDDSSNLKLLAQATASLGWTGRGIFQGYQNDYISIERLIRWNRFCLDLRNHLILCLKAAVDRVASLLNSDCRLIVEESSEYSLDNVQNKLHEGKTSTVELVNLLYEQWHERI